MVDEPSSDDDSGWRQRWRRYEGRVFLFMYKVRHRYEQYEWQDEVRFCTVFALADRFVDAERIAINCVHQHGWRILKTDTATAFDIANFQDSPLERDHFANLAEYGASFHLEPQLRGTS